MVLPVGQFVVVGAANTPSEGVPPIVVQVLGVAITIPAAVTPVNDGQTAGQAAGSTEKVAIQPAVFVTTTLNAAGSVPGLAVGIVAGLKVSPAFAGT